MNPHETHRYKQIFLDLQCARHCSKGFTSIHPHNKPMRKILSLSSFYRSQHWGTEKASNLPKVSQFISSRTGAWPPGSLAPGSRLSHSRCYLLPLRHLSTPAASLSSTYQYPPTTRPCMCTSHWLEHFSPSYLLDYALISSGLGSDVTSPSKVAQGLPWWRSGWESACQCRGHGFEPYALPVSCTEM